MATNKGYRITFNAKSVGKVDHPSTQAVHAAVENALRYIGLEPIKSQVETTKEVAYDGPQEEVQAPQG